MTAKSVLVYLQGLRPRFVGFFRAGFGPGLDIIYVKKSLNSSA